MATPKVTHKQGDTFAFVSLLPANFPAGDWSAKCELVTKKGDNKFAVDALIAEVMIDGPEIEDPDNPGQQIPGPQVPRLRLSLRAEQSATELWPIGELTGDIQFRREAEGDEVEPYVVSSKDFIVKVIEDRTAQVTA